MLITLFYFTLGVGEVGVSVEKSGWDVRHVRYNRTLIFLNYEMCFSLLCLRPDLKGVIGGGGGGGENGLRTTLRARDRHTQAPSYGLASILSIRIHMAISPGQSQPWTTVLPSFGLISTTY